MPQKLSALVVRDFAAFVSGRALMAGVGGTHHPIRPPLIWTEERVSPEALSD